MTTIKNGALRTLLTFVSQCLLIIIGLSACCMCAVALGQEQIKHGATGATAIRGSDGRGTIVVDPKQVVTREEIPVDFRVSLSTPPMTNVTVDLTGYKGTVLEATPPSKTSLTFTPHDWDVKQTVTLTAEADDNFVSDTLALKLDASRGGVDYQGVSHSFDVVIKENLSKEIIAPDPVTVKEGGSTNFSLKIPFRPQGDVVVKIRAVSYPQNVDMSLIFSPVEVKFTRDDWGEKTVKVTAGSDVDNEDEWIRVVFRVDEGVYRNIQTPIGVIVEENNTAAQLIVTPTEFDLAEGGSQSFKVKLNAEPKAGVTMVTLAHSSGNADLILTPAGPLTFTTTDWNTEQPVTVAAPDNNTIEGSGAQRIDLAASGGGVNDTEQVNIEEHLINTC